MSNNTDSNEQGNERIAAEMAAAHDGPWTECVAAAMAADDETDERAGR